MKRIRQEFTVSYSYDVAFTEGLFELTNPLFGQQIRNGDKSTVPKVLIILDEGVYQHHPDLESEIQEYASARTDLFTLTRPPVVVPGGETAKNEPRVLQQILDSIEAENMDRHSWLVAIGGGAVIDVAGYAASTAHRGIRLIRVPTTVLAQNDAAVGVKNGVNAYGKKNFLGAFDPPRAVLNDVRFLTTLDDRDWRSGISEAVKVALIKDPDFFDFLEETADGLRNREMEPMQELIYRCAKLHLDHISLGGDPFEKGSSRPLDFGHWAAHKLEQMTRYELRHGEAVAIGISLDATYSYLDGRLGEEEWLRILRLFRKTGFQLYIPELGQGVDKPGQGLNNVDGWPLLKGLEEFREHLGGELTLMLLDGIGSGIEVHEVDLQLYQRAVDLLRRFEYETAGALK